MNRYKYTGNSDDFISTKNGFIIAQGFNMIVHGERGAYVEFTSDQIRISQLYVKDENYWRFKSSVVYYIAWHTKDDFMVYPTTERSGLCLLRYWKLVYFSYVLSKF